MKRLALMFLVLVLSLSFASSFVTAQDDATSGTIVVYTALEDDQLEAYLASFREMYPDIEIDIIRDSTGIVTARLLAEKDNPQADVVWGLSATSLLVLDAEGMLEPYAPAGLDRIDAKFRDPADPPAWVGIDVWMSGFCVNTIEVEALGLPVPQSWADLLDPVYEGHLVMPNPNSSGTGFLSVSAMLQLNEETDDLAALDKPITDYAGWEYLDALHQNIALYTHSGSAPCKLAGAGEYPIGISFGYRGITQAANGEPIQTIFPAEGSGWDMEANALIAKDEIKPAAQTFLDWAISDVVMEEYARNFAITGAPTEAGVPEGFPEDPLAQLIDNNFVWAAAHRQEILDEWLARYDEKSEPQ